MSASVESFLGTEKQVLRIWRRLLLGLLGAFFFFGASSRGISAAATRYSISGGADPTHRAGHPQASDPATFRNARGHIRKIIILPDSQAPDADGVFDAIAHFLESQMGWYVAPRVLAEEIRRRAAPVSSTLDATNPDTGQFDLSGYVQGHQDLIPTLASETRVDAVLEVDIEKVRARVSHMMAEWDGVKEPVSSKGSRTLSKLSIRGGKGQVDAATAVLKLWDPHGQLLWNNRRGIATLAVVEGVNNKLRERPLSEFLQSTDNVQSWLNLTFGSLINSSGPSSATSEKE